MKKKLICIFFTSLFCLEIPSFFFIYQSNHALYKTLMTLKPAGNMVVPNGPVVSTLVQIMPAFYSSLFILFTAGIFISLLICLVSILFLKPDFKEQRIIIPYLSIFFAALVVSGIALVILADKSIFIRTRDYLLLSSTPGIAVNNFYYKYTPYAARAINRCLLNPEKSWWPAPACFVRFFCEKGLFVGLPLFCFMMLYWLIFGACRKLMAGKAAMIASGFLISGITIATLLYLSPVNLKQINNSSDFKLKSIGTMLASPKTKTRIEALRILYKSRKGIWNFPEYYKACIRSESIAEKYWLANVFSISNADNTAKSEFYLNKLIKDDSLNVKCAAIKALSKLSCNDDTLKILKDLIQTSPEWYVQQSARRAYIRCKKVAI